MYAESSVFISLWLLTVHVLCRAGDFGKDRHGWFGSKLMSGLSHSAFVGGLARYSSYALHVATALRMCSTIRHKKALYSILGYSWWIDSAERRAAGFRLPCRPLSFLYCRFSSCYRPILLDGVQSDLTFLRLQGCNGVRVMRSRTVNRLGLEKLSEAEVDWWEIIATRNASKDLETSTQSKTMIFIARPLGHLPKPTGY